MFRVPISAQHVSVGMTALGGVQLGFLRRRGDSYLVSIGSLIIRCEFKLG